MMVCDGHVFNAASLRSLPARQGSHASAQQHSCELLLHLYEEEGIAGWRRADGQFALALWDARAKRLVLGRDFLGVRPLYYWQQRRRPRVRLRDQGAAPELHVSPRAVDETALADFLTFTQRSWTANAVPGHPQGAGRAAPRFVGADGTVRVETYWDLLRTPIPESSDERFYVERVRTLHHAAVAQRDVEGPIGSLLSGGNDSSANAALLARSRLATAAHVHRRARRPRRRRQVQRHRCTRAASRHPSDRCTTNAC